LRVAESLCGQERAAGRPDPAGEERARGRLAYLSMLNPEQARTIERGAEAKGQGTALNPQAVPPRR
jgi:hypothetical protein